MRRSSLGPISVGALALSLVACEGTIGELGVMAAQVPPEPPPSGQPRITTFDCTPESGAVSFVTTCTIQATHPEQLPVHCDFAVSDGRAAPLDNADCSVLLTQKVTFETAGTFTLTLTVRDDAGLVVQGTRTVTVAPRPNRPPVVDAFTAAPTSGTVPLKTTLHWAVSDPDGDALTCSLDVGNDGSVEYPNLDCAALSQAHTLTAAGAVEVLFVVTDGKGLAAQSVLTLTARAPVGDLRISKVEWGQVVVTQSPRLVEGKSALLRVYVLADKAGLAGVTLDAEGFSAAGVSLGKLSLNGPATPPVAEVPTDLSQQWVGAIPAAWVEVGFEVRLLVDPLDAVAETDETNNARTAKPVVGKGNILQLTSVPVVLQGVTASIPDIQPIMTRMWPLKAVVNQNRAPYTFSGTLAATDTTGWGQLLQEIASVRQADGSSRNYYGFVKVAYGSGIAGIGYIGQEAATGRDDSGPTAAHELGHNLGRAHAPCGGASQPDPNYPYAGGKMGSWGYDPVNRMLLNPATFFDQMGYCQPAWTSDYNYQAVQTYLEAAPYIPPQAPSLYVPAVLVAGVIRNGAVILRPIQRLLAAPSAPSEGPWAIQLHAADGRTVLRSFSVVQVADADELHFTLLLEDPGPLARVEVLHGLDVVAQASPTGGQAPVPKLQRVDASSVRLQWDARAFAWAEVAHLGDDGVRTTLALSLSGGDAAIRADGLSGGQFEVSLSDGVAATRSVLSGR